MQIQPYLFIEGCAEEAIEFYKKVLGATVDMLMRVDEAPEPPAPGMHPPGSGQKILHATVHIGESVVMLSDGRCSGKPNFQGFSLSLNATDGAQAERLFAALADGGQIYQPLIKTFFSSHFGMLADRFGVPWMVTVPQKN
jgi:PhnB protein